LFSEHANALRESTNNLFSKLKDLKTSLEEEVQKASSEILEQFKASIKEVEQKINEGNRLQSVFDELKQIQSTFRDLKFVKEHRTEAWEQLDNAFKALKEKKYGNNAPTNSEGSPLLRTQRRYDGLIEAINKMVASIDRDKSELAFHTNKATNTDRQLEALVSQAKLAMIQERITSKEEKLSEMLKTKHELESRIADLKQKESIKEEQEKFEAAKKAVQEKIATEIKQATDSRLETPVDENSEIKESESNPIENAIETAVAVSVIEEKDSE
jgi:chromosome segregation ATPase